MAQAPSIKDVAQHANVSIGTVSNVLNRDHLVAPHTAERVHRAITELGFVRHESARHLRGGRSRAVGLVVLDITNPFFTDVARGAEDAANEAGLSVILCDTDGDEEKERRYLRLLAEQRVRGVLIVPAGTGGDHLGRLRDHGIPTVLLDRCASGSAQCSVSVDDVAGGYMAVEHLLGLGHRRIAFVGTGSTRQVDDRRQGAARALSESGRAADELVIIDPGALTVAGGREAADQLAGIPAADRPAAAFCANDLMALGLLQRAGQLGWAVPGDLAIVGYDDIEFAEAAVVPLTSIRQPRQELGRTALDLLAQETDDSDHEHRQVVFAPELVVRASSGGVDRTT